MFIGCLNFFINIILVNFLMFITNIYKGSMLFVFSILSFIVYSINGYFCNRKFTFKSKNNIKSIIPYFILMSTTAILNALLLSIFSVHNILFISQKLWTNISILLSSITTGAISFLINKFFIFKK